MIRLGTSTDNSIAIDYINSLETQTKQSRVELERQRDQMHQMDQQIKELTARLNATGPGGFTSPPPAISYGNNNGPHYSNGTDNSNDNRTLPPIMNGGAMQGVQYGESGR